MNYCSFLLVRNENLCTSLEYKSIMSANLTSEQQIKMDRMTSVLDDYILDLITHDELLMKLSEILGRPISTEEMPPFRDPSFLSDVSDRRVIPKTETSYKMPASIPDILTNNQPVSKHTKIVQDVSSRPWASTAWIPNRQTTKIDQTERRNDLSSKPTEKDWGFSVEHIRIPV